MNHPTYGTPYFALHFVCTDTSNKIEMVRHDELLLAVNDM